jgi:hypothetical protein
MLMMANELRRTLPRLRRRLNASRLKKMRPQTVPQMLLASPLRRTRASTARRPQKPSLSRRRTEQQMLLMSSRKPRSRTRRRPPRHRLEATHEWSDPVCVDELGHLSRYFHYLGLVPFTLFLTCEDIFPGHVQGYLSAWKCSVHDVYATILRNCRTHNT